MPKQCTVCKNMKRQSNMQYIQPIEDWMCQDCLKEGRENNISNIEEGRKLTAQIRGEKLE